jgi:hypothetical protein
MEEQRDFAAGDHASGFDYGREHFTNMPGTHRP